MNGEIKTVKYIAAKTTERGNKLFSCILQYFPRDRLVSISVWGGLSNNNGIGSKMNNYVR